MLHRIGYRKSQVLYRVYSISSYGLLIACYFVNYVWTFCVAYGHFLIFVSLAYVMDTFELLFCAVMDSYGLLMDFLFW